MCISLTFHQTLTAVLFLATLGCHSNCILIVQPYTLDCEIHSLHRLPLAAWTCHGFVIRSLFEALLGYNKHLPFQGDGAAKLAQYGWL
jgi:hypothetical protein